MAIQGVTIADLDPLPSSSQLAGALFEIDVLAGPVANAYVTRKVSVEQYITYLAGQGLGGTLPALQTFRFRTRAEANVGFGGQVLEELDYSTLFTYARVLVEFWRDNPADLNEKPRGQELIAVYDPNAPANHMGYATSGGPAAGVSKVGLVLVFPDDPAATGVLKYDVNRPVDKGQLRYYDDGGQGVEFYEALQDMASPVPAPVRAATTAYWKPAVKPPVPGGGAPVASLYYSITDAISTRDNNNLPLGRPTAAIYDVWNGVGDSVVYLQVEEPGRWAKYGQLLDAQGNWSFVEVDLDNARTTVHGGQLNRVIARTDILALLNPNPGLTPGGYIVTGWNGNLGLAVSMQASTRGTLNPLGTIAIGNGAQLVVCDVQAGTYERLEDYVARLARAQQGIYVVQAADVTSPASNLQITVQGATGFTFVGVKVPGVSGLDPLAKGSDYTSAPNLLTILGSLSPPLQAGYEIHYSYGTGQLGYTDEQARAANLNRIAQPGTTTVTLTVESARDYGTAASGTFTVDGTEAAQDKTASFRLGAGANAPLFQNAPNDKPYRFVPGGATYTHVFNRAQAYSLAVLADAIEVVIYPV